MSNCYYPHGEIIVCKDAFSSARLVYRAWTIFAFTYSAACQWSCTCSALCACLPTTARQQTRPMYALIDRCDYRSYVSNTVDVPSHHLLTLSSTLHDPTASPLPCRIRDRIYYLSLLYDGVVIMYPARTVWTSVPRTTQSMDVPTSGTRTTGPEI